MTSAEQLQLLAEYSQMVVDLANAKAFEAKARREIARLFGTPGKEEGNDKLQLERGAELKIEHVLNYNVNSGRAVYLQSIMPPDAFAELFRTKYELNMKAYRELSPAQREVANYAVTITNGMPTLDYTPPSNDKVI